MLSNPSPIPFRWNIKSAAELGSLLKKDYAYKSHFLDDLRLCTASILSFSDNAKLCFVGRSLDNVYDYLSGLYEHTSQQNHLTCLNISLWGKSLASLTQQNPKYIAVLKAHFTALNIDPTHIVTSKQPICFVDVVYEGGTYTEIYQFLMDWAAQLQLSSTAMHKKLRFIGVTSRTKNSPNTWRWQQHASWIKNLNAKQVKNVSVDRYYWSHIADNQAKMSLQNHPERWYKDTLTEPVHDENQIEALNEAFYLFNLATTRSERLIFLSQLYALKTSQQHGWLRDIASEIKQTGVKN